MTVFSKLLNCSFKARWRKHGNFPRSIKRHVMVWCARASSSWCKLPVSLLPLSCCLPSSESFLLYENTFLAFHTPRTYLHFATQCPLNKQTKKKKASFTHKAKISLCPSLRAFMCVSPLYKILLL